MKNFVKIINSIQVNTTEVTNASRYAIASGNNYANCDIHYRNHAAYYRNHIPATKKKLQVWVDYHSILILIICSQP